MSGARQIESFDLAPGRVVAGKYRIAERLGGGWEGEVYRIAELRTDIERSAKLFFPHHDPKCHATVTYARKLDRLRHCRMVIRYRTEEQIRLRGEPVRALVAEFAEG